MPNLSKKIANMLLDIIYPVRCVVCSEIYRNNNGEIKICEKCINKITFITIEYCKKCGRELSQKFYQSNYTDSNSEVCENCKGRNFYFTKNIACFTYKEEIRTSLFKIKYRGSPDYCKTYGILMYERLKQSLSYDNFDIIIAVPLHKKKYRDRGFNQAFLLAKKISELCNIPIIDNCLVRIRNTSAQKDLSPEQRIINIQGSMAIKDISKIIYKKILLVDDIYTTGITLNECSKVLIENGAAEVTCITMSAVPEGNFASKKREAKIRF